MRAILLSLISIIVGLIGVYIAIKSKKWRAVLLIGIITVTFIVLMIGSFQISF